jgi:hypothetical protein
VGEDVEEKENFLSLIAVCSVGLDERMEFREMLASEDVLGRGCSCCFTGKGSCRLPAIGFVIGNSFKNM